QGTERGYANLPLYKLILMTWVVSRPIPPYMRNVVQALATINTLGSGAAGVDLKPDANKRWTIFHGILTWKNSATVGTRVLQVTLFDQAGNKLQEFARTNAAANVT